MGGAVHHGGDLDALGADRDLAARQEPERAHRVAQGWPPAGRRGIVGGVEQIGHRRALLTLLTLLTPRECGRRRAAAHLARLLVLRRRLRHRAGRRLPHRARPKARRRRRRRAVVRVPPPRPAGGVRRELVSAR